MKIGVSILIVFLSLSVVSAVEVVMKEELSQGENLFAKVSGNFIDQITKENVKFYRGHVRTSFDYDVATIDEEFYVYALLGDKGEGEYSMKIEGAKYMQGSKVSEEDIVKGFFITNSSADFSVNPGFVVTNKDFSIEVQNLKDSQIEVSVVVDRDFVLAEEDFIKLKSGEIKKFDFEVNAKESILETIKISSGGLAYEIPVYIYTNQTSFLGEGENLEFEFKEIKISLSTNSETSRIVYLENNGNQDANNLVVSVSDSLKDYVSVSKEEIDDLASGKSTKIILLVESDSDEKEVLGQVKVESENSSASLGVVLNFIKGYVPPANESSSTKTCEELEGVFCKNEEKCSVEEFYVKDGKCCLGKCEIVEEESWGKFIGWIIIIGVVIFLVWFYKFKYKGVKSEASLFGKKLNIK